MKSDYYGLGLSGSILAYLALIYREVPPENMGELITIRLYGVLLFLLAIFHILFLFKMNRRKR